MVLQNSTTNSTDQSWGSIHSEELERQKIRVNTWDILKSEIGYWYGIEVIKRKKQQNRMVKWIDMLKENKEFNN